MSAIDLYLTKWFVKSKQWFILSTFKDRLVNFLTG